MLNPFTTTGAGVTVLQVTGATRLVADSSVKPMALCGQVRIAFPLEKAMESCGWIAMLKIVPPPNAPPARAVSNDPFTQSVLALTQRAGELNGYLQRMPEKKIPDLQLLTENDWLSVAKNVSLQSEPDVRQALAELRNTAKHKFATQALRAVDKFAAANNGQMPTDLSLLKPYFDVPVDDSMLQRYQVLPPANGNSLQDDWVMGERERVDPDYDQHLYKRKYGRSVGG